MSKEFEELVLNKLDLLDKKTTNTDRVIQEVILKKLETLETLETEVKDTKQGLIDLTTKVEGLEKNINDTNQGLISLTTKVEGLEKNVNDTKQGLISLTTKVGNLEMESKDTQEVVKYLNQNFIKFDYEINKKIDTLFDAHSANKDSNVAYEENIVSLNSKVFNHDIRISNLENKVLTA